jgi:hypothetical protein
VNDTQVSTTTLRWAVRVISLHTLVMLLVFAITIWAASTSKGLSVESTIATPVFFGLLTVIFGGLAVALHQMRGWARGPAIVLEMLLIPLGWIMLSGVAVIGIFVVITGFAGAVLLLAPSTREALGLNR